HYPPAAAALVADVVVHEHLCSGTAGFEAALAGVPSLLLDREHFSMSPLTHLGPNVVFKNWNSLWDAFQSRPAGLGDWSSMLGRLDPFRDGRAAERMGQYLHWALDGLKQGIARDVALADAAERYCEMWGDDKIVSDARRSVPSIAAVNHGG